ncbi:hypothetical protein NDI39_11040 [Microcoleus sp. ZQ-A2]
MFQEQPRENNTELWHKVFENEIDYIQSRQDFLNNCTDRIRLIKKALHNPTERGTALRLIEYLNLEERQSLFDDLVDLASVSHSDIELCRKAILSFPKTWILTNIEKSAEPLLQDGTDEEYRRLLELYLEIDWELTQRLALRALHHEDPDIREAGEDFQNYLNNRPRTLAAIRTFHEHSGNRVIEETLSYSCHPAFRFPRPPVSPAPFVSLSSLYHRSMPRDAVKTEFTYFTSTAVTH